MDQRLLGLDDCGCVVDSYHGWYVYRVVCEWAQSLGWDGVVLSDDDDIDVLADAADEAMDWVNDHRVTDGVSVGWWEGSVRLWSQADWEWAYGV
jgi:hypothetical protein